MAEESRVASRSVLKPGSHRAAPFVLSGRPGLWVIATAGILAFAALLPLWTVSYVPLYDYQNHLLEARVAAQAAGEVPGETWGYLIRPGWYWQSNALSSLLIMAFARFLPVGAAGRLVLTLYVLSLAGGLSAMVLRLKRSPLLLLALPLLVYNFTFTSGLLNWSLGFALLVWSVYFFVAWQDHLTPGWWLALTFTILLAYMAHIMAWGLILAALHTLLVLAHKPLRMHLALLLSAAFASPFLLLTRSWLLLVPLGIALPAMLITHFRRRISRAHHHHLRHPPNRPPKVTWLYRIIFSLAALLTAMAGLGIIRLAQPWLDETFPDLGFSLYAKLHAPLQLFTLPYHAGMVKMDQAVYNLQLVLLLASLVLLIMYDGILRSREIMKLANESQTTPNFQVSKSPGLDPWREAVWLGASYVMLLVYLLVPTRTADIIATEPRVLLTAVFLALFGVQLPRYSPRRMVVIVLLAVLAASGSAANWIYAHRYNDAALRWSSSLAKISPGQRVLVFTHPQPPPDEIPYRLLDLAQFFDQHQFASTYALEHNGFISNTFFNGPLLPFDERVIPPYWWSEFTIPYYLEHRCSRVLPAYEVVMVWNLRPGRTQDSLEACFGGPPTWQDEFMAVWELD